MRKSGKMKIVAVALSLCCTAVLGACGSGSSQTKVSGETTSGSQVATELENKTEETKKQEEGLTGELNIFVNVG